VRRDGVIVVTDAAAFNVNTGIVVGFPTKAAAIPSWPGALANRGAPAATPLFAPEQSFSILRRHFAAQFDSFIPLDREAPASRNLRRDRNRIALTFRASD